MTLFLAFVLAAVSPAAPLADAGAFANLPLPSAQSAATEHSPDVALAQARVRESAATLAAARGAFGPALTANYAQSPQAGTTGGTITQHLTTLGAQVTLGDLLAYSPAVAQANANLQSARFDLASSQRLENVRLIGLYYDALRAVATAGARADALRAAQADSRAAGIRFKAGDAPRLDVVRANVALARSRASFETANAQRANALEALSIETGTAPAAFGAVAPDTSIDTVSNYTVDDAVRKASVRRPEIASLRSAVSAEAAAVRTAERAVLPVITLAGGYTRGVDSGINVAGPSATAQLTLPISNAASQRSVAERARLAQAQARLEAAQRQVTVEVGAAVRTYDADGRALVAAQDARRQAEEELNAVTLGYRSGASSSLEVSAARQTYVQAVLDEVSARYAHAQARATLELLIGK